MNSTKLQIKRLEEQRNTLIAERDSEYTQSLGQAAVKCVQETLDGVEHQLAAGARIVKRLGY